MLSGSCFWLVIVQELRHSGNIYKHFESSKSIVPFLSVTIESSSAEDSNILASPLPERNTLLEWMSKVVVLPVLDIIRELDLSVKLHLDVVQEGQIELPANDELLACGENKSSTVVGLLQSLEELARPVIRVAVGLWDVDLLASIWTRVGVRVEAAVFVYGARAEIARILMGCLGDGKEGGNEA